jgi:hypothetical protein
MQAVKIRPGASVRRASAVIFVTNFSRTGSDPAGERKRDPNRKDAAENQQWFLEFRVIVATHDGE